MTEKTDSKIIENIGMIAGSGLIALALIVLVTNFQVNVSRNFWGSVTGYSYAFPNAPYSVILGVLGFILIAVGYSLQAKKKKDRSKA